LRRFGKITLIEGDDCRGTSVDCGFQNHIVIGVGRLRPPSKCEADWLGHRGEVVQDTHHLGGRQSRRGQMFRPRQYRFILQKKWDRKQQNKLMVKREEEKLPGSADATAQGGHHHVRVEDARKHAS
jgi:hypothetical protein